MLECLYQFILIVFVCFSCKEFNKGMCLVDWTEIAESFDVVVAIGLR
jgi:hypothetical protein